MKRDIVLLSIVVSFLFIILKKTLREDPSNSQLVTCVHPAASLRTVGVDVHRLTARRPLLLSLV